ncbi:reverse transcriptase domain-containing protein [Tanacetum coccineum]
MDLEEPIDNPAPPVVTRADNRTMAQLLQAPTEGYEDAIVVPAITADNFKLKHGLLTPVQNKQFFGHDKEDPHAHIRYFNKITSTMKFPNVPTPATVKAVEENCVTCGGAHSHRNCLATDGNVYHDNIQEYVSQAAVANFNQGNTGYRPPIANQIRPPGFPPVQQNQGNNQNHYDQNWGNNYNQGPIYQPPVNQAPIYRPPINQPPAYQALAPQTQGVSKEDFQNYIKANDAVMRNMQNQTQNMQNQMTNLTDLLTKFMNTNTASTSGSGSLPSNTVANPKSDLKAITTRSGVSYNGTQVPPPPSSLPKVVNVKPSAPKPNPKPSIPYPSRLNDQKIREKANNQIEKFYQIFQDLHFDISFADALILMPKFASTLKSLISNKEKLFELVRTPLNEHCSAVLLKKLPEKLGDPDKILIPYDFPGMDECLALADLGASINLMPLSVWKKLSFPKLTLTWMTLELADRSISQPIGIAEDVYVKVGKFQFPADFVVVDFDADPRVPLILGRSFLKTGRALIDVYEGELTLRSFIWLVRSILKNFSVSPIDLLLEEVDAFLDLEDDPTSPEVDHSYYDSEGDILLLEAFLNDDPSLPPPTQGMYLPEIRKELKICEAKNDKSSIDEPPEVELKDLPPHLEYAFLEGDDKLPVIIAKDLSVEEKAALIKVLKSHKRANAWKLSDIKGHGDEDGGESWRSLRCLFSLYMAVFGQPTSVPFTLPTQRMRSIISIVYISPKGFLPSILMLVVIIVTVVIVTVILVVVVVDDASPILKLSFVIIGFLYRIVL